MCPVYLYHLKELSILADLNSLPSSSPAMSRPFASSKSSSSQNISSFYSQCHCLHIWHITDNIWLLHCKYSSQSYYAKWVYTSSIFSHMCQNITKCIICLTLYYQFCVRNKYAHQMGQYIYIYLPFGGNIWYYLSFTYTNYLMGIYGICICTYVFHIKSLV